jgi:hypothetical protein
VLSLGCQINAILSPHLHILYHSPKNKIVFPLAIDALDRGDYVIDKSLNSKQTQVYSNERWALPRSDPNLLEDAMYEPLVRLLNAILEWKWKKVKVTRRTAIDTHLKKLPHKEPVPTTNKSSPDISVKAEGSSFQLPHRPTKGGIGYENITTFVEVKVTNQPWLPIDLVLQVAAYAR